MAGRRPSTLWEGLSEHFLPTSSDGGKWSKAGCRYCQWHQSANSYHMQQHWHQEHSAHSASSSGTEPCRLPEQECLAVMSSDNGIATPRNPFSSELHGPKPHTLNQRTILHWAPETLAEVGVPTGGSHNVR